jgi:hypothetical protein
MNRDLAPTTPRRSRSRDKAISAPWPELDNTSFEEFLDELATAFVRVSALDVDGEIEHWLQQIVEVFDADRSGLWSAFHYWRARPTLVNESRE